jgi:hypothetical protein
MKRCTDSIVGINPKPKQKEAMKEPTYLDVVFDGPPSHESGRFIEVEHNGRSINAGEWIEKDGLWYLRIDLAKQLEALSK